jgi:hypothetical protein
LGGAALAADTPAPEPGGATWFTENGADFTVSDWPRALNSSGDDTDTGFLVGGVLGYNWAERASGPNSSYPIRRPISTALTRLG